MSERQSRSQLAHPLAEGGIALGEPSSPEDGTNFSRSLQIDMKGLMGDAVGNMSISPGSRDVVLAARKGLFIIDLEAPLNVPRFLPQGGTWDVADVQWNPHPARKEYIVSTSSERLLIWNLHLIGKTSIQHILRAHYRAITDINWHTTDPDIVVSTGIDAWLWAWDLRTVQKPVMGLSAFNAGGTQVKWNRKDGNILASSHGNEVLIWDRRNGSLPISRIIAHTAKIYGIDWSHDRRDEIVTCSLDKTIKVWDIQQATGNRTCPEPVINIRTTYPVWRARDLPFGRGVLSLPQRGETALEMWTYDHPDMPVEEFEGHDDVVKEFVWRRGGDSEFQLITWSKDKTLRFWPVDAEVMEKAGRTPSDPGSISSNFSRTTTSTFSQPPIGADLPPVLSAPIGHRAILAEVRAPLLPRPRPRSIISATTRPSSRDVRRVQPIVPIKPAILADEKGATMSRGHMSGRSAPITTIAWLSSVKVGARRGSSSGPGSGGESGNASRLNSQSRPQSVVDWSNLQGASDVQTRSRSRDRLEDEYRENDWSQSVHDEVTSVVAKLNTAKVKLETAELSKRRICTFGLHGPWGDSTSVFIRISFIFPRDYPYATHPGGTPVVELERNPLISIKNRVFILRRLRAIRENQRPCLEACLRFLLFGDEDEDIDGPLINDSESSSEEDEDPMITRKGKETAFALLRSDKNLAEPRTSQGVFGPSGELVCFFRAPPRFVRNHAQEAAASPSEPPHTINSTPNISQSPALLSDAMRHLSLAVQGQDIESVALKRRDDAGNAVRILANLFASQKARRPSEHSRPNEDTTTDHPIRRSPVYISDVSTYTGAGVSAASEYLLAADNVGELCRRNAEIARNRGRIHHERVFTILQILCGPDCEKAKVSPLQLGSLVSHAVKKLYDEFVTSKDIQMLAMMSIVVLRASSLPSFLSQVDTPAPSSNIQKLSKLDYFSFRQRGDSRNLFSPVGSHLSPAATPPALPASTSSPTSSRGSWSSLFNTSTMRHFMTGKQGTIQEGEHSPYDGAPSTGSQSSAAIPVPGGRTPMSPQRKVYRRKSPLGVVSPTTHSWSEIGSSALAAVKYQPTDCSRRPTFSQVVIAHTLEERKGIMYTAAPGVWFYERPLDPRRRKQLVSHILVYAELLLRWQLPQKRSELLKSVEADITQFVPNELLPNVTRAVPFGIVHPCARCARVVSLVSGTCTHCGNQASASRCTICRLPIKGLSYSCLKCFHVTHMGCWTMRRTSSCASGCGCQCVADPAPLL